MTRRELSQLVCQLVSEHNERSNNELEPWLPRTLCPMMGRVRPEAKTEELSSPHRREL